MGFESKTTEFCSDALTGWAIRPWVEAALWTNFLQLLQFHSLFSVRFHFSYCCWWRFKVCPWCPNFTQLFVLLICCWWRPIDEIKGQCAIVQILFLVLQSLSDRLLICFIFENDKLCCFFPILFQVLRALFLETPFHIKVISTLWYHYSENHSPVFRRLLPPKLYLKMKAFTKVLCWYPS